MELTTGRVEGAGYLLIVETFAPSNGSSLVFVRRPYRMNIESEIAERVNSESLREQARACVQKANSEK